LQQREAQQQASASAAATNSTGLIAREDALEQIIQSNPTINYVVWFIRGALILLDLMPIILKALHVMSGSVYEQIALASRQHEGLAVTDRDLKTQVEGARLKDQALADQDVNRVVIDVDRDRRIDEAESLGHSGDAEPWAGRTKNGSACRPAQAIGFDQFVHRMKSQPRHEAMPVALPSGLKTAARVGTALVLALTAALATITIARGQFFNAEWLVFLTAAAAISLAIFTKGFRRAPPWALRASFIVLLAGLALPFLVAGTNL
jgi:hypothetical protein